MKWFRGWYKPDTFTTLCCVYEVTNQTSGRCQPSAFLSLGSRLPNSEALYLALTLRFLHHSSNHLGLIFVRQHARVVVRLLGVGVQLRCSDFRSDTMLLANLQS